MVRYIFFESKLKIDIDRIRILKMEDNQYGWGCEAHGQPSNFDQREANKRPCAPPVRDYAFHSAMAIHKYGGTMHRIEETGEVHPVHSIQSNPTCNCEYKDCVLVGTVAEGSFRSNINQTDMASGFSPSQPSQVYYPGVNCKFEGGHIMPTFDADESAYPKKGEAYSDYKYSSIAQKTHHGPGESSSSSSRSMDTSY
jgi:hypothetical protein